MYNKSINRISVDSSTGYAYFCDIEHPLSHKSGKVYLHRHILSLKLGRWLTSTEQCHHKDGNKLNNDPSNLECVSVEEHTILHANERGCNISKIIACSTCEKEFMQNFADQKFCSPNCAKVAQIKNKDLTKELLDELIPNHSWIELGKMFGYSDNGIKKRAKSLGCVIPVRKIRVI